MFVANWPQPVDFKYCCHNWITTIHHHHHINNKKGSSSSSSKQHICWEWVCRALRGKPQLWPYSHYCCGIACPWFQRRLNILLVCQWNVTTSALPSPPPRCLQYYLSDRYVALAFLSACRYIWVCRNWRYHDWRWQWDCFYLFMWLSYSSSFRYSPSNAWPLLPLLGILKKPQQKANCSWLHRSRHAKKGVSGNPLLLLSVSGKTEEGGIFMYDLANKERLHRLQPVGLPSDLSFKCPHGMGIWPPSSAAHPELGIIDTFLNLHLYCEGEVY